MKNTGLIPRSITADDNLIERLIEILFYLHTGQGQAITTNNLVLEVFGSVVPRDAGRTIRDAVDKINKAGGLICSSPACGYWWAQSLEDGLPSAEKKLHRAQVQLLNAKKLENNLRYSFSRQETLL